jgi:hypothetical protein
METLLKLLTSLKTNEKLILITIIANALILYLICFVGFEEFQTYQWYQQLIISSALSICYSVPCSYHIVFLSSSISASDCLTAYFAISFSE